MSEIQYILTHGKCGCNIGIGEINRISKMVKAEYHFSAPDFWMWKMYQFGFARGKQVERARRAKDR